MRASVTGRARRRREERKIRADQRRDAAALRSATIAAVRAWKAMSRASKLALVQEILETRREELTRAYPQAIAIAYGFGTRRADKRSPRSRQRTEELGITFLVARKRSFSDSRNPPRWAIPKHLFAYGVAKGKRTLCAVPTDVESSQHLRLRSHGPPDQGRLVVQDAQNTVTAGVGACIVRLPNGGASRFMISCHHVLGMTEHALGAFPVGADVSFGAIAGGHVQAMAPVVGNCSNFYGVLRNDVSGVSFDAALAMVRSGQEVSAAVLVPAPPGKQPTTFARFKSEIESLKTFSMRCAGGARKALIWQRYWPTGNVPLIDYDGLGPVALRGPLVEYVVASGEAEPGDSGSAIVSNDDTILVGMHIAGSGKFGFMIPSFELFRANNYVGLSSDSFLSLA